MRLALLLALVGCAPRLAAPASSAATSAVAGYAFTSTGAPAELELLAALSFVPAPAVDATVLGSTATATATTFQVGEERVTVLVPRGLAPTPPTGELHGNDAAFQHIAVVVSDLDASYRQAVAAGARPISRGGPQTIPLSNPAAGGIRAVYLSDPDGHAVELIWYPAGKGDPRWQARHAAVQGIDHSAIAVADTARSRAFYEALGLTLAGESLNQGPEQEALSGVDGAVVRISGLRGTRGPGVELLEYLSPGPGRPARQDASPLDLQHWETIIEVSDVGTSVARATAAGGRTVEVRPGAALVRDPDGHAVRLVGR